MFTLLPSGSHCVPFPQVLKEGKYLKNPAELDEVFRNAGIDVGSQPLVGTCGSGLTASILALAVYRLTGKVVGCLAEALVGTGSCSLCCSGAFMHELNNIAMHEGFIASVQ